MLTIAKKFGEKVNKIYRNSTLGVANTFRIDYIPDRLVVDMTECGLVAFRRAIRNTCTREGMPAVGQRGWPTVSETEENDSIAGVVWSRGKRGELFSGKLTFTEQGGEGVRVLGFFLL